MLNKALAAVLTVGVIGTVSPLGLSATEASGAAVVKYMTTAKVSLQEGLKVAESEGQPISGKFEVNGGHLQLSVYTAKDGKFSEVLVDQSTGKVAKSEAITGNNDLAYAQKQMEAYSKSKTSLKNAVSQAELANPGYRAVSVTPRLSNGRPVAVVSLVQGTQVRSIAEPLT
ncbi:MAG TPA: PepSY domain-containing protein [Steroidobacteraceae bacterium]